MRGRATAYFLLNLASALLFLSYADDTLTPSGGLGDDDDGGSGNLISTGGRFELGFFSPKGSSNRYVGIWYHNISDNATTVWVANGGSPVLNRSGRLRVTANGRLVLTDGNSTVFWSSGNGSTVAVNAIARLLDDGNLVVKDGSDTVWQSFDFPTDTLLPGMKMGWNRTSGHNIRLRAWTNESDPTPGNFVMGMDLDGVPQELVWNNMVPFWRLGPWNGQYMGGAPEVIVDNLMDYEVALDSQMFVYWYTLRDPSMLVRTTLSSDGRAQAWAWLDESHSWISQTYFPRDVCDYLNSSTSCGPYSLCRPTMTPMCACLEGFRPKNQRNWDLQVGSDGCVRKTELDDCRTDNVGFFKLRNAKLPDTSRATVDWSMMNLDDCKALCLKNCSCRAYARANVNGRGSGCIIWTHELIDIKFYNSGFGQELYLKLADRDIPSQSAYSRRRRVVMIVLAALSAAFVLTCAGGFICYKKRRNSSEEGGLAIDEGKGLELDLPLLDFSKIVDATSNFSTSNVLGEGGFGLVYKGNLGDHQEIAVKRLSQTSTQGVDEFKNEVMLIAKLQHRNLVRLLGCCIQGGERILIYEYMPNGSLDSFLFDKTKSTMLDWQTRYDVIVGIARGLLYLHHDSRFKIIHRDLKASNILLDQGMNPKISDFGMARIFASDETEVNTKRVVGTYGYMSPEYAIDGIISVKSDVFSFGVLILEIISGKRSKRTYYSEDQINLLGYAWKLWKAGEVLKLVDETLGTSFPVDEVLSCIKIGLLCVQEQPRDRPTMPIIVKMLGGESAFDPDPKQPGFFSLKDHIDSDASTRKSSRNNITITMPVGR